MRCFFICRQRLILFCNLAWLFLFHQCLYYKEHPLDPNSFLSSLLLYQKLNNFIQKQVLITFNPPPGVFQTATKLEMVSNTSGGVIHYTIDGTEPKEGSPIYTEPIPIWQIAGRPIQAILIHPDLGQSQVYTPGGYYSMPPFQTGQTNCYNSSGSPISCSGTGQDGELKKGITQSYTSLPDGTVVDTITNFVWPKCSYDQTPPNCTASLTQINYSGAINNCNAYTLAGKTWRLPNRYEMESLILTGASSRLDPVYFNIPPVDHWTISSETGNSSNAFLMNYSNGFHYVNSKTTIIYFRCIHGKEYVPPNTFEDLGNGSIQDHRTGLVWTKCSLGQTLPNCTGGIFLYNWDNALIQCNNLNSSNFAGRQDWRLPNAHELLSIVRTEFSDRIHTTYFPNADTNNPYWTSTTHPSTGFHNEGLIVRFSMGTTLLGSITKTSNGVVRCVSGP